MAVNKVLASLQFGKRPAPASGREPASEAAWTPNTDVYCTDDGFVIKVELAGMRKEDLELTVEGHQLRISGYRRDCCRAGKCKFMVMEINYGPFESVIELPPNCDLGSARASYQNGFLRVDVPFHRRPPDQPHSVPIVTEES
jgi:HSP20 family protein